MAFKVAITFDIEASCYAAAVDKAYEWQANIKEALSPAEPDMSRVMFIAEELVPEGTVNVHVETTFEVDRLGQRVLFLPNEDEEVLSPKDAAVIITSE